VLALLIPAAVAFHAAYRFPLAAPVVLFFLYFCLELAATKSARWAFYSGLTLGMLIFPFQLVFFWKLFGAAAVLLWVILAFWTAIFLLGAHHLSRKLPKNLLLLTIPSWWMACEYFRSELYYLKFSWINVGFAFSGTNLGSNAGFLGVYGIGFVLVLLVVLVMRLPRAGRGITLVILAVALTALNWFQPSHIQDAGRSVAVAGVQMEFQEEQHVLKQLDRLAKTHPQTELYVLSEYTFPGPIPVAVLQWCLKNKKYLIVGGKELLPDGDFFNTAFVAGPDGKIVFKQVKSVPIQFFADGKPAESQDVWNSPWGKIGICICYDFSYRRVVDGLIKKGAEALIIPTMDVIEWGAYQHQLHSRVGPTRAVEFRVPVFRLCSSGISQVLDQQGRVQASAPFPGEDAMISGELRMSSRTRLPADYWLAPAAVVVSVLLFTIIAIPGLRRNFFRENAIPVE
jgi:apolipoprotein N-acyltransferase